MPDYRLLEHTADIGISARGPSLAALFEATAEGLRAVLTTAPRADDERLHLAVTAPGREELLVAWLQEILYRFESVPFLPARFEVTSLSDTALEATLFGTRFDPLRHPIEREVKAVTFHRLKVGQVNDHWEATVYLDL